jgi:O-antigen/teichoic acid export membrane protein
MGAWIAGIGAVLTIVVNVMFIPSMGYMGSAYAVLLCFVIMTVISYVVGQKYYRVEYDLKRILIYLGLSIVLYYLSESVQFSGEMLKYVLNIGLFGAFVGVVFLMEKNDLRTLFKR